MAYKSNITSKEWILNSEISHWPFRFQDLKDPVIFNACSVCHWTMISKPWESHEEGRSAIKPPSRFLCNICICEQPAHQEAVTQTECRQGQSISAKSSCSKPPRESKQHLVHLLQLPCTPQPPSSPLREIYNIYYLHMRRDKETGRWKNEKKAVK